MQVVIDFPPNYEMIKNRFDIEGKSIVFTYGDKIFNPQGTHIADHVIEHEKVHMRQQEEMGIEEWWAKYLLNDEFRVSQETEAYQTQFDFIKKHVKDRNKQFNFLQLLARDLSSEMYGNAITKSKAVALIKR